MLTNVMLLCLMVLYFFAVVGLQLWKGLLRQRCFPIDHNLTNNNSLLAHQNRIVTTSIETNFYKPQFNDHYICTFDMGMSKCEDINLLDSLTYTNIFSPEAPVNNESTLDTKSQLYRPSNGSYKCSISSENPFKNAISFDNIFNAMLTIFQVNIFINSFGISMITIRFFFLIIDSYNGKLGLYTILRPGCVFILELDLFCSSCHSNHD
jgi:hypothetical protein